LDNDTNEKNTWIINEMKKKERRRRRKSNKIGKNYQASS